MVNQPHYEEGKLMPKAGTPPPPDGVTSASQSTQPASEQPNSSSAASSRLFRPVTPRYGETEGQRSARIKQRRDGNPGRYDDFGDDDDGDLMPPRRARQ